MTCSDVAQPAVSAAERPPSAVDRLRRLGAAQYELLAYLRMHNWEASAYALAHELAGCNYRARISELRANFLIHIEPFPPHPAPGERSVYRLFPESRPRANYLLAHGSLEGFDPSPMMGGLFK